VKIKPLVLLVRMVFRYLVIPCLVIVRVVILSKVDFARSKKSRSRRIPTPGTTLALPSNLVYL
jgi:hypothetical protein